MKTLNRINDLVKEVRRIEGENEYLQLETLVDGLKESFDNVNVRYRELKGLVLKQIGKGEYKFLNSNIIDVKISEKKGYVIELEWNIDYDDNGNDCIIVTDIINANKVKVNR